VAPLKLTLHPAPRPQPPQARDIYQPFRLGKQLMEASALGGDVGLNLIHLLGDADSMLKNRNAQVGGVG
jgi:hypothetical protein